PQLVRFATLRGLLLPPGPPVKVFDQGGEPVAVPALLEEVLPEHRVPVAGVREAIQHHRARGGGRGYTFLRWLGVLVFASVLIDLIAAVPSIVVGLWGLLVLVPLFEHRVEPWLSGLPVAGRLAFAGAPLGSSLLLASVVLAVMVLPTVVALSRTALSGVAVSEREAARALGATRWQ